MIAGDHRGRRLAVPDGDAVRPTKDIVREAMFSALDARGALADAVVLDLFAGSGALAIEALSRGSDRAVLVERDHGALDAIGANLGALELVDRARVVRGDVKTIVRGEPPREAPFDLVFIDPPYSTQASDIAAILTALAMPGWLTDDAIVSLEGPERPRLPLPDDVVMTWERSFGDTLVRFLKVRD